MTRRRQVLSAITVAVALATLATTGSTAPSGALFTARTANGTAGVSAAPDWTPPSVSLTPPPAVVRGTISLTVSASDAESGVANVAVDGTPTGAGAWTALCAMPSAPWSCTIDTATYPDGVYDLRATAVDGAGYSASSTVPGIRIDNTAPSATLTLPTAPLAGSVPAGVSLVETGSGLSAVELQRAPTGTSAWTTTACAAAAETTCQIDTTSIPDAVYDFRVRATDVAGNVGLSNVVTREIRNRISVVAMQDPGPYIRGTTTFTATASSNVGVTSVRIQRSTSSTGPWTDICTDAIAPFSCTLNSNTIPDGDTWFRAVMVDGAGVTNTSTVIGPRTVDNSPVRGIDIQAIGTGNYLLGNGDVFLYTYSQLIQPDSLIAGWDGSSRNIIVRAHNSRRGERPTDYFEVYTDNSWSTPVQVGQVEFGTDVMSYFPTTLTFNGTITMETTTLDGRPVTVVRLTLGNWRGVGVATPVFGGHQMIWHPSNLTRDHWNIATSPTATYETGPLDNDV